MRLLLPVLIVWCMVTCGCAESPAPNVGSPTDGTDAASTDDALGYEFGQGEIVFRFDASDYDNVTRNDTG